MANYAIRIDPELYHHGILGQKWGKKNMANYAIRIDPELYHHGILGQKWGKKNGPPYPLGYSDHSTAEKKQNPKSRIGGKAKGSDNSQKHSNDMVKYAAIGAIAVGSAIFLHKSGIGKKVVQSIIEKRADDLASQAARQADFEKIMNMSLEELEADTIDFFKDTFGDISISKSIKQTAEKSNIKLLNNVGNPIDDCIKHANPNFNINDPTTSNNCVNSSIAFCMRRLGLDVSAKPISIERIKNGGYTTKEVGSALKGMLPDQIKIQNVKNASDVKKSIEKQILSSCDEGHNVGMFTIFINGIGGHDMAWEKMPGSNTITLYDPARQDSDMSKYYDIILANMNDSKINSIRLDDCEIDGDNLLKLFVKNA